MLLSSLFLSYTSICQTCETLEQSASSTRAAPYLVTQSTDADQCSPLLSSVSPPIFYICPPSSVTFPTSSIHICPRSPSRMSLRSITVMPQTVSFPLHVSLFPPPLNPFFCYACLSSFFKSLKLVTYFPTGLVFIWYNFLNFLSLPQQHAHQSRA